MFAILLVALLIPRLSKMQLLECDVHRTRQIWHTTGREHHSHDSLGEGGWWALPLGVQLLLSFRIQVDRDHHVQTDQRNQLSDNRQQIYWCTTSSNLAEKLLNMHRNSYRKHPPIPCARHRMSAPTGDLKQDDSVVRHGSRLEIWGLFLITQMPCNCEYMPQRSTGQQRGLESVGDFTWTISSPARSWTFWGTILLLLSLSPNPSLPCSPLPHPYTWKKGKEMNWLWHV